MFSKGKGYWVITAKSGYDMCSNCNTCWPEGKIKLS